MTEPFPWWQTKSWRLFVVRVVSVVRVVVTVLIAGILCSPDTVVAQEGRIGGLMNQAEQLAESDSTEEALNLYEQVLEQDSTVSNAYREMASLYARQEQYVEAAQQMERLEAIRSQPSASDIGTWAKYLVLAGEDLETAQDLALQAMRMDLNTPREPIVLGHAYLLDRQPRTAKFYYRKAMERMTSREDLEVALSTFDTLVVQGHPEEPLITMKDWYHVTYLKEGGEKDEGTSPLALLGTWITVVVGLVSLFEQGGDAMTKESQALVRGWLVWEDRKSQVSNWPDSFKSLFDAVFTERHFSWTCFLRSVLASAIVVVSLLLGMVAFGVISFYELAELTPTGSVALSVTTVIAFTVLLNSVVDYVSLYQTRWLIGKMAETGRTAVHIALLALDAVLTTAIFIYSVSSAQFFAAVFQGFDPGQNVLRIFVFDIPMIVYRWFIEGSEPILWAVFISTFFTSVWIWLYALAGVTMRGTLSLFRGVDLMRNLFDVEERPIHALGMMLAVLATVAFLVGAPFLL